MLNGLDHQNLAGKERAKVDLETCENQNYTGKKLPKKREMWLVYAILILVVGFIVSSILKLFF